MFRSLLQTLFFKFKGFVLPTSVLGNNTMLFAIKFWIIKATNWWLLRNVQDNIFGTTERVLRWSHLMIITRFLTFWTCSSQVKNSDPFSKFLFLPNNVCTSICFYIYVKSTPSVKFTHSVFFKYCFFFANEFYKTKIIGSDSLIMKERYCYNKAAKSRPGVCSNKSIVDI